MAAKELDEWTRAAERAEMRLRLQARPRGFPAYAGIDHSHGPESRLIPPREIQGKRETPS